MTLKSTIICRIWIVVIAGVTALAVTDGFADDVLSNWIQTGTLSAPEANQAVAADDRFLYVIDNKVIARYDRSTGERLAVSIGAAHHLNSGFILERKLYAAHSNFPKKPECSEVKVLDLQTMVLSDFKSFGESPHGSLTVVLFHDNAWWCVFARYGAENGQTVLVEYDRNWNEKRVLKFPESVISDLGKWSSVSGGIWRDSEFLATGHDKRVIYRLRLPESGDVLVHQATMKTPFPGQGIAIDPVTGGLVGINRKEKQVIFASPEHRPD
ncbi:MAG TPA: hypothetical protein VNQ76_02515 [Planctomicrobium sp.]|nr:hypothetical protein [Planctomicrobium sp.]